MFSKEKHDGGIISTLDHKVNYAVTHVVGKAAMETGVARSKLDDDYFENTNILKPPWM
jgi:hypothetical protein